MNTKFREALEATQGSKTILNHLKRHFVGILCEYEDAEGPKSKVFSSFVLSVNDCWFLITAGHCVVNMKTALKHDGWKYFRVSLLDAGSSPVSFVPQPFPRDQINNAFDMDEKGIDFGVIPIPELVKLAMEKNGIEPLDEKAWKHRPPFEAKDFYLLGVPDEFVAPVIEAGGHSGVDILTCLNRLKILEARPQDIREEQGLNFFAKVELDSYQSDITGMSGGPIFAIRRNSDNTLTYWLVAVQSRWVKTSRNIGAGLVYPLATTMEAILKELTENSLKEK